MGVGPRGTKCGREAGVKDLASGLANWVGVGTLPRGRVIRGGVRFFLMGRVVSGW